MSKPRKVLKSVSQISSNDEQQAAQGSEEINQVVTYRKKYTLKNDHDQDQSQNYILLANEQQSVEASFEQKNGNKDTLLDNINIDVDFDIDEAI